MLLRLALSALLLSAGAALLSHQRQLDAHTASTASSLSAAHHWDQGHAAPSSLSCIHIPACQKVCVDKFPTVASPASGAEAGDPAPAGDSAMRRSRCFDGCAFRGGATLEECANGCSAREEVDGAKMACDAGCESRCRGPLDQPPMQDPVKSTKEGCRKTLNPDCDSDKYDRQYAKMLSETSGYAERIINMQAIRAAAEVKQMQASGSAARKNNPEAEDPIKK